MRSADSARLGHRDILLDTSISKYRDASPPPRGALLHDRPAWRVWWHRPLVLVAGLTTLTLAGLPVHAGTVVSNLDGSLNALRTLTVTTVTHNSATLTISDYTGNWYYKYITPQGGNCSSVVSGTSANLSGLQAGTDYAFRAYSDASCGSMLSTPTSFTTPPPSPAAPTLSVAFGRILVRWVPEFVHGATKYQMQYRATGYDYSSEREITYGGQPTDHEISTSGTLLYTVRFRAGNAGGWGPWSNETSKAAVCSGCPSLPTPGKVAGVSATSGDGYLDVSWTAQTGPTDYEVQWKSGQQDWDEGADGRNAVLVGQSSYQISGLSNGTSYTIRVAAFNGGGTGAWSDLVTATPIATTHTPPPASPEISASAVTAAAATLTITNYGASWYYKRTAPTDGDHPYGSCSPAVGRTSVMLTGLTADTSYSFTAYSDSGCKNAMDSDSFTTLAPPPDINLSPTSLTLREGSTKTYTVRLDSEPSGTVTVALASSDTTVATVSPASLSFTASNWDQAQTVTVTGVDNAVDGQDGAATISHGPSGGGYDAVADVDLEVSVSDDDVRSVSLSPTSLTLREGSTKTYTVRLDSEPSGTVTVALASSDTTVATVSPASLSFTASNWDQAQTVTVTGVDNAVDGQDGAATISHGPSGGGYDAVADVDLEVSVSDDDVRSVSLSPTSLTLREGSTKTYTVRLDSEPSGTVTVALASSDTTVATVSPASLSFTASNWDQAQTVTVTGVDNAVDGQDGAATISHGPSGGGYDAVADVDLEVSVSDDDVRSVSLSPTSLTLREGSTKTYTVRLDSEPSGTVTVALASSDTTVATVSPASLSFTASNWDQAQTVTVTGVDNAVDGQDGAATISHGPQATTLWLTWT